MEGFQWNEEKNSLLKQARGIGFEEVVNAVKEGRVIYVADHPNKDKYPKQKILIVVIRSYAYLVPYVPEKSGVFLKTIIPSRKAVKKYLNADKKEQ
jgi:uncharacterized DUF497 family protein